MASLKFKTLVFFAFLAFAFTQTTFPSPDSSWNNYQIKSCCPKGFIEVYNYCVRCAAPNFFDPIDNKCKACPADHIYNNITNRCECFSCKAPRVLNPVNNQCECKVVNGTQMTYKSDTNECICP